MITGDTYVVTKTNNSFIHARKLSKDTKEEITNWAVHEGLLEPSETVTVSWYDDEMGSTMQTIYPSMKDAEDAFGEELEDYEVVSNRNGIKPSEKLKHLTKNPNMSPTGVFDYILPLYAEQHGYDGVWWQDRLSVNRYSAPRGVIVPSKIHTWNFKKLSPNNQTG